MRSGAAGITIQTMSLDPDTTHKYPNPDHRCYSDYLMLDRQRITCPMAAPRLQYKPQVSLPGRYLRRPDLDCLERIIADYISGMTDRFCEKVYRQAFADDDTLRGSLKRPVCLRRTNRTVDPERV